MTTKLPMQPIILDEEGTPRFRQNHLVRYLLDAGSLDLNDLVKLPGIPIEDWEQFAQLIGYSICGFGELNYASNEAINEADFEAAKLLGQLCKDCKGHGSIGSVALGWVPCKKCNETGIAQCNGPGKTIT